LGKASDKKLIQSEGASFKMAKDKQKEGKEKPLEKMTVKELKEVALQIPEIIGVHGMNKQDLIVEIKKARGIEVNPKKNASKSVKEVKQKIKALKQKRVTALETSDSKMAQIYRRRIARLKRKTRRAA
jgi:predicted ATP-grasp superfamily ATP-dependent carboligase